MRKRESGTEFMFSLRRGLNLEISRLFLISNSKVELPEEFFVYDFRSVNLGWLYIQYNLYIVTLNGF